MNKYEKNNVVIVVLVTLLLLAVGAVVYFMYFYIEPEANKDKVVGYVTITNQTIIDNIKTDLSDKPLYLIAKLERDIINFNLDLTNTEKVDLAYNLVSNKEYIYDNGINIRQIDSKFQDIFKDTITFDKDNIICSCDEVLFIYNNEEDKYIYNEKHLGHGTSPKEDNYYSKIIDVKSNEKKYIVTMVNLWYMPSTYYDEYVEYAYGSYSDALNNTNPLFQLNEGNGTYMNTIKELEDNYDKYKDHMKKYIYTLEKEEDNYLLISFQYK